MLRKKVPFNDLGRIRKSKKNNFLKEVKEIIDSGIYLKHRNVNKFEMKLCNLISTKESVAVGSGTAALEIAFESLGLKRGSKVALVANAGGYGTIALGRSGLTPCFIDVEQDTGLINLDLLNARLKSKDIRAILITHLYGNVVDMDEILKLAKKYKFYVIEDCSQAIGGKVNSKNVGSFGDLSTFSFYPTKNLGGAGDGGAISGRNQKLIKKSRELAQYGWKNKYQISTSGGTNSRMDEIQAAYINLGFEEIQINNQKRRNIAKEYHTAFGVLDLKILTNFDPNCVSHLFVIVLPTQQIRKKLQLELLDKGVSCEIHYPIPDHQQVGFQKIISKQQLPITESLSKRILSLPIFPQLRNEEVKYVIKTVKNIIQKNKI